MESNTRLIAMRVESGDRKARFELLERLFPDLLRECRDRQWNGVDMESALQSMVASFLEKPNPGRLVSDDLDVLGVLRHRLKDHYRNRKRRGNALKRGGPGQKQSASRRKEMSSAIEPFTNESPDLVVILEEGLQLLMGRLTDTEREILDLTLDGKTQLEVGEASGRSRSSVFRTVAKIKAKLSE